MGKAVAWCLPHGSAQAQLCGEPRTELAGGMQGRSGEHWQSSRILAFLCAEMGFTSKETDELFQAVVSRLNDAIPLPSVMYVLMNRRLMNFITR